MDLVRWLLWNLRAATEGNGVSASGDHYDTERNLGWSSLPKVQKFMHSCTQPRSQLSG